MFTILGAFVFEIVQINLEWSTFKKLLKLFFSRSDIIDILRESIIRYYQVLDIRYYQVGEGGKLKIR